MKIILSGNGPYLNRGCEAITRGTINVLTKYFPGSHFVSISFFPNKQILKEQIKNEYDRRIKHLGYILPSKYSLIWWLFKLDNYFRTNLFGKIIYRPLVKEIKDAAFVLSLGGDNYSASYSLPYKYMNIDKIALNYKKKTFIWGGSVGPFNNNLSFEDKFKNHLQKIGGVFAREDITFDYLTSLGLNNVWRISDPATVMITKEIKNFEYPVSNSIGLNFSPLMAKYITNKDVKKWEQIVYNIVESLLKNTTFNYFFIPHVFSLHSDDFVFMKKIFARFQKKDDFKNRIYILEEKYNSSQIKWIISKLQVFAGARTHSTIAALSTNVPTLSFAYSEKAFGINKDFYGHTKYCITNDEINPDNVTRIIKTLIDNNTELRDHLSKTNEEIKKKAYYAGELLTNIL